MGSIRMSERALKRIEVLGEVLASSHVSARSIKRRYPAGWDPGPRSAGRDGRYAMRAVVLREYGGPEKLKFEDNVPEPPISGGTVLIATAAAEC